MGGARTAHSSGESRRTPTEIPHARDRQRAVLSGANRLLVAFTPPGLSAVPRGVSLLQSVAQRRDMAADPPALTRRSSSASRTRTGTQRRDYRQSVGQNDGKRGVKGFDFYKKVRGRKRHLLVDTLGLILTVVVHGANLPDREGSLLVFRRAQPTWKPLEVIWADAGYSGLPAAWVANIWGKRLEVIAKPKCKGGFHLQARRWVIERTFA